MKRLLISLLILNNCLISIAQDTLKWKKIKEISIVSDFTWDIDPLNQLIIGEGTKISKYDSELNLLFQESIKSAGNITSIDARNPMKILLFHQQQQHFSIIDNSLNFQQQEDFTSYHIGNALHLSGSETPSKIWVFDQENTKIIALNQNKSQNILIENTKALLDFNSIYKFKEYGNDLYLVDTIKGIYQLDNFGSLLNSASIPKIKAIHVESNAIILLLDHHLVIYSSLFLLKNKIKLPKNNFTDFRKVGEYYYFKGNQRIEKFSFSK